VATAVMIGDRVVDALLDRRRRRRDRWL